MGLVKIELPFEGLKCNGCEWEVGACYNISNDFCDLYNQYKGEETRGSKCIENELREAL